MFVVWLLWCLWWPSISSPSLDSSLSLSRITGCFNY
jgi:hypothetical protein